MAGLEVRVELHMKVCIILEGIAHEGCHLLVQDGRQQRGIVDPLYVDASKTFLGERFLDVHRRILRREPKHAHSIGPIGLRFYDT